MKTTHTLDSTVVTSTPTDTMQVTDVEHGRFLGVRSVGGHQPKVSVDFNRE